MYRDKVFKDSKVLQQFDIDEELPEYIENMVQNKQLHKFYEHTRHQLITQQFTINECEELLDVMDFLDINKVFDVFRYANNMKYKLWLKNPNLAREYRIFNDCKVLQVESSDKSDLLNNKQFIRFYQNDRLFTRDECEELLKVMLELDNINAKWVCNFVEIMDYKFKFDNEMRFKYDEIRYDGIMINDKLLRAFNNNEIFDIYGNDFYDFIEKEVLHQLEFVLLTENNTLFFELDYKVMELIRSRLDEYGDDKFITIILKRDNYEALNYLFDREIIYLDKNGEDFFDNMIEEAKKLNAFKCLSVIRKWLQR